MAAKEQQRQRERAHSLRQSATLLQLRQQAPSAVLPVFNQTVNQPHVASLQEREAAHAQLPSGPAHAQMMPGRGWGAAPPPGYPVGGQPPSAQYAQQDDEQHWAGNYEQPAVHAGFQPAGWQGGEEQPRWQHDAAAQAQRRGHDAQTLTAASGRRSWHESDAAAPPLGRQAPSAEAGMPALPLPLPLPVVSGSSRGSTRPSLVAIGAGTGAATQREAEQRKRAAYQADLAAQMQLKQERQRQVRWLEWYTLSQGLTGLQAAFIVGSCNLPRVPASCLHSRLLQACHHTLTTGKGG